MENFKQCRPPDSPEPEGCGGLMMFLDTAFRKEFAELQTRHDSVVETMAGCKELFSLCNTWIYEQTDFTTNNMKKAMVLAFYEKIQSHQTKLMAEYQEIEPRIMALAKKIQGADAAKKEAPHGRP